MKRFGILHGLAAIYFMQGCAVYGTPPYAYSDYSPAYPAYLDFGYSYSTYPFYRRWPYRSYRYPYPYRYKPFRYYGPKKGLHHWRGRGGLHFRHRGGIGGRHPHRGFHGGGRRGFRGGGFHGGGRRGFRGGGHRGR